jgi:hypothetical protein
MLASWKNAVWAASCALVSEAANSGLMPESDRISSRPGKCEALTDASTPRTRGGRDLVKVSQYQGKSYLEANGKRLSHDSRFHGGPVRRIGMTFFWEQT